MGKTDRDEFVIGTAKLVKNRSGWTDSARKSPLRWQCMRNVEAEM